MAKVLYINANVKDVKDSHSLSVGEAFIKQYQELNPNDEIEVLDLYKMEVPIIDDVIYGVLFNQLDFNDLDEIYQHKIEMMNKNLEQFINADKYVIASPLWNLGVPPMLKAYFDNVTVANKTFKYTEFGPQGLLENKKAVCIQAAGGIYYTGKAHVPEYGISYIKTILSFLGVSNIETINVEGVNILGSDVELIKQNAIKEAIEIANKF